MKKMSGMYEVFTAKKNTHFVVRECFEHPHFLERRTRVLFLVSQYTIVLLLQYHGTVYLFSILFISSLLFQQLVFRDYWKF